MDQNIMHNLDPTKEAGGGSPHVDDPVDSHSNEPGTLINGINDNGEKEQDLDGEDTNRSPYEALEVIKEQETHNLYCPKCTCNITQTAQLFEIGKEPSPYNNQPFILWVPLVFPCSLLSCFRWRCYWEGLWTKLKNLVQNCLPWLSLTSLRFLLVAVLLLLSVIVLWSSPSPSPSPSPLPRPDPPSPPPPPGPPSPSPQPRRHLSEKIRWVIHFSFSNEWVIHFVSIKYLFVLSLLFFAILALPWPSMFLAIPALPWPSISFKIEYLIEKITRVWPPAPVPGQTQTQVQNLTPTQALGQTPDTPLFPPPPLPPVWRRIVVLIQSLIPRELDILKSIVYGGLIESITSLGVVSSAAASGASTLNVLALGLANLFSGLVLIIHNLYGLIASQPEAYQNLLGNRRKVKLHCFVVVVSFFFFGAIPPLFYGLSFKRTDKGHYKAAVVLAASLVCVISLSFAKAYSFGTSKLKAVSEYTGMAIGASALSFIASHMVADVFDKYGFHELASDYRNG